MSKVEIPLSGWQQTPEERGGQPRIARLTNAMLDNQGRIIKSPGQAKIINLYDGVNIAKRVIAQTENRQIYENPAGVGGYYQPTGHPIASLSGSAGWVTDATPHGYLSPIEAPRLTSIFNDPSSHYVNQGVLSTGNYSGDVVVYAERLTGWAPSLTNDVGTFSATSIVWCLLSGNNGLKPVKYGEIPTGYGALTNKNLSYPTTSDKYLFFWSTNSSLDRLINVYHWDDSTLNFALDAAVVETSVTSESFQTDIAWSAKLNTLFLILPTGLLCFYRPGIGFGNTGLTFTPYVGGACGIAIYPSWSATEIAIAVVVQTKVNEFESTCVVVNGSLSASAGTAEVVFTSPQALPNSATTNWVKRPEVTWSSRGSANMMTVLLPNCPFSSADTTSVVETCALQYCYEPGQTVISSKVFHGQWTQRYSTTKAADSSSQCPVFWTTETVSKSLRVASLCSVDDASTDGYGYGYMHDKAYALVGGDPGISPDVKHVGPCGPMVYSTKLPPVARNVYRAGSVGSEYRAGYVAAVAVLRSPTGQAANIYLTTTAADWSIPAGNYENPVDVGQTATVNGVTYVASGLPSSITTEPDCPGFHKQPPPVVWVYSATGSSVSGEVRRIVTVLKSVTKTGETVWGPVSDPQSYTFATNGSVAVKWLDIDSAPSSLLSRMFVYQEVNGVYHLVNGPSGGPSTIGTIATIDASHAAAVLGDEPILYTQGANGAISGQLDHFGCPPCRTIWAGRNRIICGGLWDERRVQFSNLFFPSEAVSWPMNAAFYARVDDPVTAVAAMDDYYFVFARENIWVIAGAGPDNMGIGSFEAPLKVSTGLGCPSWRSVVDTPLGLMFQGNTGQIYLIPKGSAAPTVISQAIRDSVAQYSDTDPGDPTVWVKGAVFDSHTQEVIFATYNADWVLQLATLAWRKETIVNDSTETPMTAQGCGIVTDPVTGYTGPAVFRTRASHDVAVMYRPRRRTETGAHLDAYGAFRGLAIDTTDIDLGRGRFRRGWVRVSTESTTGITSTLVPYSVSVWFDGLSRATAADEVMTIAGGTAPSGRFTDLEYCPARQRCNQLRVRIADSANTPLGSADHVLGIWLDIESSKQFAIKTTTGNGRLT